MLRPERENPTTAQDVQLQVLHAPMPKNRDIEPDYAFAPSNWGELQVLSAVKLLDDSQRDEIATWLASNGFKPVKLGSMVWF